MGAVKTILTAFSAMFNSYPAVLQAVDYSQVAIADIGDAIVATYSRLCSTLLHTWAQALGLVTSSDNTSFKLTTFLESTWIWQENR